MGILNKVVVLSHSLGYHITRSGQLISKTGRPLRAYPNSEGYMYTSIRFPYKFGLGRRHKKLRLHKLAAYQKYGDRMFEKGIQVRHLDGNSQNNCLKNIVIGTASQNMMDRPREQRFRHACRASSFRSKLSAKQRKQLLNDLKKGIPYSMLTQKYGLVKSTISYWRSKLNSSTTKVAS